MRTAAMDRLFDAYRSLHDQAFVPIFAQSDFDSKMLLDACLEAGLHCIEYTLRRDDAHRMIPWIREHYPELFVLVGSTLDDDGIIARSRQRYPQLMTLAQLDALRSTGLFP